MTYISPWFIEHKNVDDFYYLTNTTILVLLFLASAGSPFFKPVKKQVSQ
jgi:hypothetical protein